MVNKKGLSPEEVLQLLQPSKEEQEVEDTRGGTQLQDEVERLLKPVLDLRVQPKNGKAKSSVSSSATVKQLAKLAKEWLPFIGQVVKRCLNALGRETSASRDREASLVACSSMALDALDVLRPVLSADPAKPFEFETKRYNLLRQLVTRKLYKDALTLGWPLFRVLCGLLNESETVSREGVGQIGCPTNDAAVLTSLPPPSGEQLENGCSTVVIGVVMAILIAATESSEPQQLEAILPVVQSTESWYSSMSPETGSKEREVCFRYALKAARVLASMTARHPSGGIDTSIQLTLSFSEVALRACAFSTSAPKLAQVAVMLAHAVPGVHSLHICSYTFQLLGNDERKLLHRLAASHARLGQVLAVVEEAVKSAGACREWSRGLDALQLASKTLVGGRMLALTGFYHAALSIWTAECELQSEPPAKKLCCGCYLPLSVEVQSQLRSSIAAAESLVKESRCPISRGKEKETKSDAVSDGIAQEQATEVLIAVVRVGELLQQRITAYFDLVSKHSVKTSGPHSGETSTPPMSCVSCVGTMRHLTQAMQVLAATALEGMHWRSTNHQPPSSTFHLIGATAISAAFTAERLNWRLPLDETLQLSSKVCRGLGLLVVD
jgi:hypothetical protein